jgi:phosphomevalonate kinase
MKAKAPGKVVLSGAYAVLEGSPCIVTAVDRYVTADATRPAQHIAAEVREAMAPPFPHIDASELRAEGRKLGLGSSAAIVVASLATSPEYPCSTPEELHALYERALLAHRRAQGGGSGVDVASASFGGTLCFYYDEGGPGRVTPTSLPDICLEIWSCPQAAVTSGFLRAVRELKRRAPDEHGRVFQALDATAKQAVAACGPSAAHATRWLAAMDEQASWLATLGELAEIPIFTDAVTQLRELARREGAVVMPSGAGGGDLALFFGHQPPSQSLLRSAAQWGVTRLPVRIGARGVHRLDG